MQRAVGRTIAGAFACALIAAGCGSSGGRSGQAAAPTTTTTAPSATTTTTTAAPKNGVDLSGTPGVTPTEEQRAEALLLSTRAALHQFATPEEAYAAGYRSIGDRLTGDEHYVKWSYVNDGHILDPNRPESLVYEERDGKQQVAAAMYMLPFGSRFTDVPDVGGALTQWHVHKNLCLTDDPSQKIVAGITSPEGGCRPGTSKAGNTPMLHVWAVPNPCGPFAALEGIGAGQVPEGQTRECDTTHSNS